MEIKVHQPNPILLTFPQNIPPRLDEMGIELLERENNPIRKAIKLNNNFVTYVGKSNPTEQGKFLIGVVSKKGIDVYPEFESFSLQQFIHKQFNASKSLLTQNTLDQKLTHFQQQVLVAEEMGTNKSRRKMKAMENNRVQEANISQAQQTKKSFQNYQDELVKKVEEEEDQVNQVIIEHRRTLLPTFNVHEKNDLRYVFDINSIISDEDEGCIDVQQLYVGIMKKPELLFTSIKNFQEITQNLILGQVDKLALKTQSECILFLKHCVFLDVMLKFAQRPRFNDSDIQGIAKQLRVDSTQIIKSIIAKFYLASKGKRANLNYNRGSAQNDKFISYLIILTLYLHDFDFEADKLCQLLKLTPNKFLNYAKMAGLTATMPKNLKGEQSIRVRLNMPLKFPQNH